MDVAQVKNNVTESVQNVTEQVQNVVEQVQEKVDETLKDATREIGLPDKQIPVLKAEVKRKSMTKLAVSYLKSPDSIITSISYFRRLCPTNAQFRIAALQRHQLDILCSYSLCVSCVQSYLVALVTCLTFLFRFASSCCNWSRLVSVEIETG